MGYAGRDSRGLIYSFSGGSGPVHAQYLYCSTSYEWITQCFNSWGSTCSHSRDVGVYCESKCKLTMHDKENLCFPVQAIELLSIIHPQTSVQFVDCVTQLTDKTIHIL